MIKHLLKKNVVNNSSNDNIKIINNKLKYISIFFIVCLF